MKELKNTKNGRIVPFSDALAALPHMVLVAHEEVVPGPILVEEALPEVEQPEVDPPKEAKPKGKKSKTKEPIPGANISFPDFPAEENKG